MKSAAGSPRSYGASATRVRHPSRQKAMPQGRTADEAPALGRQEGRAAVGPQAAAVGPQTAAVGPQAATAVRDREEDEDSQPVAVVADLEAGTEIEEVAAAATAVEDAAGAAANDRARHPLPAPTGFDARRA